MKPSNKFIYTLSVYPHSLRLISQSQLATVSISNYTKDSREFLMRAEYLIQFGVLVSFDRSIIIQMVRKVNKDVKRFCHHGQL